MTAARLLADAARHLPAARCAAEEGSVTMDVPREDWLAALAFARDVAGCDFFDWLTAVDEQDKGLAVVVHLYSIEGRGQAPQGGAGSRARRRRPG